MRLDRLNSMEQYILEKGTASLEDLAGHFSVSLNTVRRDISELLERGQIKKVYGGVAALNVKTLLPLPVRAERQHQEKQAIGRFAASLVKDHSTIFLDSGSTTVNILPYLAEKSGITVITHSLSALYEAAKYPEISVIALGGQYSSPTSSYVGANTLELISNLSIDTVFIAATGVSIENGLSNNTYFEAEIKRCVTRRSKNTILLADHTKFDRDALISFCELSRLSAIVTGEPLSAAYERFAEENHIALHYAGV